MPATRRYVAHVRLIGCLDNWNSTNHFIITPRSRRVPTTGPGTSSKEDQARQCICVHYGLGSDKEAGAIFILTPPLGATA
jgi:hypothetical protein